jgi:hypothetical protein
MNMPKKWPEQVFPRRQRSLLSSFSLRCDSMNLPRTALALLGLVFLFLAYVTRSVVFLVIAVAAFAGGLVLMGAFRRKRTDKEVEVKPAKQSRSPKPAGKNKKEKKGERQ